MAPRTWVLLSDKRGDNGQVETIVEALDWPVENKFLQMKPEWVLGKPRYRPCLEHLDLERSDPLQAPWPDLIITVGRRPSMAALWVREQSGGHTKIALVGKPSGHMGEFDLIIASAENQMPPLPSFLPTTLPLMRIKPEDVASEAAAWAQRFAPLPKPLIAILVGGETNPFIMNRQVARDLAAKARWVVDTLGGTPYITTSRRTTPEVLEVLRAELPPEAVYFEWSADATENPYRALLGSADGFIVTADSISMMVEVIYLRKPLAIFPLPGGWLGTLDQGRRSLAHWLFNPRRESAGDRLRLGLGRLVYHLDYFKILSATRDFRAFHRMLVERGLAVWAGQPFRQPEGELPDDVGAVVRRIESLF
ncbi:nucleoside-diphosphate sugar epimerase [Mangrovimicrobium sediminis]|uniref:Nucleoside-diphosphate sugar epimerase n=1 Tax=Mangrovimicrobium sediminis TaxID=2562682 RepID=A0A4Z0LWI6_9GAMM|nr:ELM1/GtrOC1 family putative glycosyltransferase [Haliea sp. SAOS-164]TGD71594.1 nucleoside-diphosphate sugar epimerase [Haliea sp. SAOS-164]